MVTAIPGKEVLAPENGFLEKAIYPEGQGGPVVAHDADSFMVGFLNQFRHLADAGQGEGPPQDRNVGIQPLAGQQGAPGRAGDPQRAIDADAPFPHQLDQLPEVIALGLPTRLAKQLFAGIIQLGQGS